jgi:uracil-DNA glycosylase
MVQDPGHAPQPALAEATVDGSPRLFPFGAPLLPRPPSASELRPVYVLGAYPSGLHVAWTAPPAVKLERPAVRALLVDNEPTPFWTGEGEAEHFQLWMNQVGWDPGWGEMDLPASGTNGPSGAWVESEILQPLGLSRSQVCISDCLDTARLNPSQSARIQDTYVPVARALGLPECTVPPVPNGEAGIVREACEGHLDRLRAELDACAAGTVITLGNAALRVFGLVADQLGAPSALASTDYGAVRKARVGERTVDWLPLVHPRSGERTPHWAETHRRWKATAPTLS